MNLAFAPLKLEGYYVEELRVSVQSKPTKNQGIDLRIGLHVQQSKVVDAAAYPVVLSLFAGQHQKERNRYRIELHIQSDDKDPQKPPYKFRVVLVGFFRLDSVKNPSTELEHAAVRNAAMILYSSARELLASVTGRGPYPAIVLPTVTFDAASGAELAPQKKRLPKARKASKARKAPAKKR